MQALQAQGVGLVGLVGLRPRAREREARLQTIRMTTWIAAPVERVFLLSLSVELHLDSARRSRERAVAGVTSGLMRSGDRVTWSGRHFGLRLRHESVIDGWRPFTYFRDSMVSGTFRSFRHEHHFAAMDDGTRMRDELHFTAPLGRLGRMVEGRVRAHLLHFLWQRNERIKQAAESGDWHRYLDGQPPVERS